MKKNVILISIFIVILLSSCIFFQTINQPSVALPNEIFTVSITATTQGGGQEPNFGVCLPIGWTIPGDSLQCSGVYNEAIYYDSLISSMQENASPAPGGYYWWAGEGVGAATDSGDVFGELQIQTDNQTGIFSIDYMLGHSFGNSYSDVNLERSNDHLIEIVNEYTPSGLQATVVGETVLLNWAEPINTNGLLGYYVYCDQQQVNPLLVTSTTFIDEIPLEGIHYYSVSSYYSDGSEYLIPYEVQVIYGNSLYVSPTGSNNNSGSSFGEALLTINYAFSVLASDSLNHKTIYLSQGIFSPSTNGEVFPLEWKNYVSLKGISEVETILDGDNLGRIVEFNSISEAKFENLRIINGAGIYCSNSNPTLQSVTISSNNGAGINCYNNSSPTLEDLTISFNNGIGIYCDDNSSPRLKNAAIIDNEGRGVYCSSSSSPTLENVIINKNNGGGIYCVNSSPTLDNVIIASNSAPYGGGVYCKDNSNPNLRNVTITNNIASINGGGIFCSENSNPSLENIEITNNSASAGNGGGIYCYKSGPILKNVNIINNNSNQGGAGIYCYTSTPLLLNVTISGNSAGGNGGGICGFIRSNPILKNCILWNNTPEEIYFWQIVGPNTVRISYSDIQGGETGIITNNNCTVYWLEGNIDEDPLFVGTGDYPYTLSGGSNCIDAGDPNPIYNDPEDPNNLGFALWPAMGTLRNDMGAYGGPNAASWIVVSIEDDTEELQTPTEYELAQNYPNPFNPSTTIQYSIKERSSVEIVLYDILGREVEVLINEEQDAGYYKINFNAARLASGIYLYRIQALPTGRQAGSLVETKKMILLK